MHSPGSQSLSSERFNLELGSQGQREDRLCLDPNSSLWQQICMCESFCISVCVCVGGRWVQSPSPHLFFFCDGIQTHQLAQRLTLKCIIHHACRRHQASLLIAYSRRQIVFSYSELNWELCPFAGPHYLAASSGTGAKEQCDC